MKDSMKALSKGAQLVLKAVDNPKYKARTIQGIAKESRLTEGEVITTLNSADMKVRVIRVPGVKKNNKPLYVTIERYKSKAPLSVRILNMLKTESSDE